MFDWLDNTVIKLCNMPPVGTDLNTVKEQLNEMKVGELNGTWFSSACFVLEAEFCSWFLFVFPPLHSLAGV